MNDKKLIDFYNKEYEQYFDTYTGKNNYPSNLYRLKIVKYFFESIGKDKDIIKILDAGCGGAQVITSLLDEGYINIRGIDLSKEMINYSKIKLKELNFDPNIVQYGDVKKNSI